jgi:D-glycero-D-manno-heptose 1,7-bisphosphate phosphatase
MKPRRFAVLDRDGTIIVERHYLSDPAQVELIPGVADGLRRLRQSGLGLIVITNQSGIGRGFFDWTCLERIHGRLHEVLRAERVAVDGLYVCPHTPQAGCPCRKPKPALLQQAAQAHGFEPRGSFVIGDKACDIELGRAVGAVTFLVRTGYGGQVSREKRVHPDYIVDDVAAAALIIRRLLAVDGEGAELDDH